MGRLDGELIERLRGELRAAFAESHPDLRPVYYAIGGSRLYGTNGPDSDVDVRGFHCADGARYALLDPPEAQIDPFVDRDEGTEARGGIDGQRTIDARGAAVEIDCASYELRKFGRLLAAGNFNAAEAVVADPPLLDELPERRRDLRALIGSQLRPVLPARYAGMARSLHRERLRSAEGSVAAKPAIYALRAALAAEHVRTRGTIEPDFERLAAATLRGEEFDVATRLLAVKREEGDAELPRGLAESVASLVGDRAARIDGRDAGDPEEYDRERTRRAIDEWMLAVRRDTATLPP